MATRAPTTRKKRVAALPRAVGSALSADARHALAAIETMNPLRGLTATGAQNLFDAARQGDTTRLQWLYNEIEAAIPAGTHVVALDERGSALTTAALAAKLSQWQGQGGDVALLIGGPDGLHPALRQAAHERIRLSDLTLPHAMVRVLLVEQLYRAWSINAGHPYHRD